MQMNPLMQLPFVQIRTLNDKDVPPAVQKMIADKETEITTDDASKLIGCINANSF